MYPTFPRFVEPVTNVTVTVGRDALLACVVEDLRGYKRRLSCKPIDLPNSSLYIITFWPSVGAACCEETRSSASSPGVDCTGHLFCFLGASRSIQTSTRKNIMA
ncbi:hypothetical protein EVAR_89543_1 [Eumeta japonica]|uniref:Ig-like domain-containing protein n=1 Tax=Eumeta variegata TaxID=151549 RepID=A0A4C1ZA32_EUMVA|nr:hypothetical protein EVAR_89543_1 [Eumeta japonica]